MVLPDGLAHTIALTRVHKSQGSDVMADAMRVEHRELSPQDIGAMLLLAVMWGLSIPVTKYGLGSVPPLILTAMRFAVAVPVLAMLVARRTRLSWRALPRVAGLGVLGVTLGQVAQAFGVQGTSASVGTIISATIPVFIVIFAAVRLKQRVTGRQQLGVLAAFAGIALIALRDGPQADSAWRSNLTGAAWLLLSAVSIAFYYVWSVELTNEFGTVAVAGWSTMFGFVAMLPLVIFQLARTEVRVTSASLVVALYLGLVVTVAGLFLWLHILRSVPARVAASVQYLQPVVGVAASSAIFGDSLGASFALGVVLILGGLALAVATQRAPEEAVPHE